MICFCFSPPPLSRDNDDLLENELNGFLVYPPPSKSVSSSSSVSVSSVEALSILSCALFDAICIGVIILSSSSDTSFFKICSASLAAVMSACGALFFFKAL